MQRKPQLNHSTKCGKTRDCRAVSYTGSNGFIHYFGGNNARIDARSIHSGESDSGSTPTRNSTRNPTRNGVKTRALEDILEVLAFRLDAHAAQRFKPALYTIDDLQRLKGLLRAALSAENPEDFQQALDSSNSDT